jgi:glycosyltransferase involved in cell wall biosynthesis
VKVALVASSYLPRRGAMERHVYELAWGLHRRGVEVEVLTQNPPGPLPPVSEFDGFVVRRFVGSIGGGHVGVARGLWEHLHRSARGFDVVHAHTADAPVALAVARARPRHFVFTPHAAAMRLLRWPYVRMTRAVVDHAAQITCTAAVEGEALRSVFSSAADRISIVPHGVDFASIAAASPFEYPGIVVLTVGRLERSRRIDRAIAALAALPRAFRLAVVGDGPARERLLAHAADLQVASRLQFVGSVPDAELHRWLRTARAVLALSERDTSGMAISEALTAGVPVVASDIPVHHEAAAYVPDAAVKLVPSLGSPLAVADAIQEAANSGFTPRAQPWLPPWDHVVEQTLSVYARAISRSQPIAIAGGR